MFEIISNNPDAVTAVIIIWAFIQFLAFLEGSEVLYRFSPISGGLSFILVSFIPLFGPLYIAYIGFVGATRGWKWPVWISLLVIAPGLVAYTFFTVWIMVNFIADRLG